MAASKYSMTNTEVVIFADNTFWHKKNSRMAVSFWM